MKYLRFFLTLTAWCIALMVHALVPENGKTYYLYCDNDVQQWFYNNNGTLAVAANCIEAEPAYLWTCTKDGNNFYFANGAGGNLGYKAITYSDYAFRVSGTDQVVREGCVTIYAIANSRYLVMKADGGFDQATIAGYDKESTNFSSDFVFVEYQASATNHKVTINSNYPTAQGRFSYGEKSITGDGSLLFDPENLPAQHKLTCTGCDAAYVFEGFFVNGQSVGTEIDLSQYTTDFAVEARFRLDCFSQTYGEKWVRLTFARLTSCCATVQNGTEGETPYNLTIESSSEGQLWCLVGTADAFKLYNKLSGESLALTADGTSDGTATYLTAAANAKLWHFIDFTHDAQYAGFAISLPGNNSMGFNSYGGDKSGWPLKFWNAEGGGSHWLPVVIDTKGVTLNFELRGTPKHPDTTAPIAAINMNVAGNSSQQKIYMSDMGQSRQFVLPAGSAFSITRNTDYHGFRFAGVEGVEDATQIPTNGTATVVFEATEDSAEILYHTGDEYNVPYRIPSIAKTQSGRLIAISDRRYCGADIGNGRIDLVARTSDDNGTTWGKDVVVRKGSGTYGADDCGFGDACMVADRESDRVLMMCVAGNVTFPQGTRQRPNRASRTYSNDGGKTWSTATDITDMFYALVPNTRSLFVGSGRICQSRLVKKGNYYRLYAAMLTITANSSGSESYCNFVIYSDDFGMTWSVLGGTKNNYSNESACVGGDEPKVEELPNGDIVLSSRKSYGRYFNVYNFKNFATDQETGTWGSAVQSNQQTGGISIGSNSCNGEIISLDVKTVKDGKDAKLLLQSIPFGNGRTDVGIWYRTITNQKYTPVSIASNWTKGLQVSKISSAYSTMIQQADGRIGFLFEEGPEGYNIVYVPLSVEQITGGKYTVPAPEPVEPTTVIPENGKTYYIYCDNADADKNDIQQYLFVSSSGLSTNTELHDLKSYQWTCTQTDGVWTFRNRDSGSYLGLKTLSDTPYGFTVDTEKAFAEGNVTIYCIADSKYLAATTKGVVAAVSSTYDKTKTTTSTDFRFVEVNTGEVLEGPLRVRIAIDGSLPVNNPRIGTVHLESGTQYMKVDIDNPDTTFTFSVAKGAELQAGADYLYRALTFDGAVREGDEIVLRFTYDAEEGSRYLTYTLFTDDVPYRIPAVTATKDGRLINFIDRRYSGDDIGNNGRVDICETHSDDGGNTWTPLRVIRQGSGKANANDCGYGDACTVADRESGRVLMMSVAGSVRFTNSTRAKSQRVQRTYSDDGGDTWSEAEDFTDQIMAYGDYAKTGLFPNATGLFITSGRICQSRLVKVGQYYRIYAAVIGTMYTTKNNATTALCNHVIYSDDFGQTWAILGGKEGAYANDAAIPKEANEAKVEELANGNVVITSRKNSGRYMNVFSFTDFANDKFSGKWGTYQNSNISVGAAAGNCNGDLLWVPATETSTGKKVDLYLQSLPCGTSREDVGVWYKVVEDADAVTSVNFARDWKQGMKVSSQASAYSSMTLQPDGRVAMVLEEAPTYRSTYGYCTVYVPLTVEQLTKGAYTYDQRTGIREMEEGRWKTEDGRGKTEEAATYDLSGRRVSNLKQRGIYVQNGKKIVR